jgi:hypothetical protein
VRGRLLTLGLVAGLFWGTPKATAQSVSPESPSEGHQYQVTPYLWGSGLVGQLGIGNRTADVDASFSDILDHLHIAAMVVADARWNRIVAATDLIYIDLRGERATPGPLFSSVNPQQKLLILTPEGGYRVVATDSTSLDIVGGIRYWHLNNELMFKAGALPDVDLQASRGWVDGIVGARVKRTFLTNFSASAYGDVGAGGSTSTYQIAGIIGWDFHEHVGLIAGYRYLKVKYDQKDVLLDVSMKGPLLGVTIRF